MRVGLNQRLVVFSIPPSSARPYSTWLKGATAAQATATADALTAVVTTGADTTDADTTDATAMILAIADSMDAATTANLIIMTTRRRMIEAAMVAGIMECRIAALRTPHMRAATTPDHTAVRSLRVSEEPAMRSR